MPDSQEFKIAFLCPSLGGGGAERATLNLAIGVAAQGFPVDFVLSSAWGPLLERVPTSVRIVDLRAHRVLAGLPALARYLRRERPRAMVSALDYANVVALWARRLSGAPVRLIVTERNTMSRAVAHTASRRERLMPRLVRRFYPWADAIVAVSAGVADDLARCAGLPRQRVRVIYNATVTPDVFERAREPLDDPWFRPGAPPVVLGLGRLTAQKDFPTLLRAFALLPRQRSARLLILGEGEERARLETLAAELDLRDRVRLPGFVKNPYPYLAAASVFALSSAWEGLPNALIEALALGTPAVATDCPSGAREVLEDGRWGALVPVGDASALAQAIARALDAPRRRDAELAVRRFTQAEAVRQYLEVIGWPPATDDNRRPS